MEKMMKKELYMSLLAVALLTGCGGSDSDSDSGESTTSHNQGISCASCHATGSGAEGKYFRSGATVYADLNSSTYVDGYSIRLIMDNNVSINYIAGRGTGNSNTGLYNTTLDGYKTNSFTAKLYDATGKEVRTSGTNTHSYTRLDCNSCHTAAGLNNAPGRIAPLVVTTTTTPTTTVTAKSFSGDVMPVLEFSCKSCHGNSGNFTITTSSATYSNIKALSNGGVDTNNSTNSYLLQKSINTLSHGGGAIWSTAHTSYTTVKTWIEEGALNN